MQKFHTSKALGQNFINDQSVIDDIADAARIKDTDLVIEIGPGMGALTEELINRAGQVVAIELDERLIPIRNAKFGMCSNFHLIHGDILKTDLSRIIEDFGTPDCSVKLLGNLPYYITTPILMHVLEARLPVESFTIMVQKEVAERLSAGPGGRDYGAITAVVQYYAEIEYIRTVERDYFTPQPKVDSAVIRLDLRTEPPVTLKNERAYFEVVKQAFSQRRKNLGNSLTGIRGKDKVSTLALLDRAGIDPQRRAETLELQEFADIANCLD